MKIKLTKDNWSKVRVGDKVYMFNYNKSLFNNPTIVTGVEDDTISMLGCAHSIGSLSGVDYFEKVYKTLETLDVGDEVFNSSGRERRILMAQGEGEYRCYLISKHDDIKATGSLYTAHELKELEYTIKQRQDQEQPRELTIDEIAEKFGMKAEDVRIKKEAE